MLNSNLIKKKFKRKINATGLRTFRNNNLVQGWETIGYNPAIKIYGNGIYEPLRSGISFVKSVFGLSKVNSTHFFINFGYKPFQRAGMIRINHWRKIKRVIENNAMLEKRLKKFCMLSLRTNVKQGNLQSSRFWRGLPIHGQNARTNGKTARKLNIVRLPPNMRLKSNSPFIMVNKNPSRVLSKKFQERKQGVPEKGQYARNYKKKKK
jgi:ribosomal protein S13